MRVEEVDHFACEKVRTYKEIGRSASDRSYWTVLLEYRNALQPMGILKHTACELLQIEMEIQILYHVAVKGLLGQVIKRCCEISYSCMPRYIPRIRAVGKHAMIAVDFLP